MKAPRFIRYHPEASTALGLMTIVAVWVDALLSMVIGGPWSSALITIIAILVIDQAGRHWPRNHDE